MEWSWMSFAVGTFAGGLFVFIMNVAGMLLAHWRRISAEHEEHQRWAAEMRSRSVRQTDGRIV